MRGFEQEEHAHRRVSSSEGWACLRSDIRRPMKATSVLSEVVADAGPGMPRHLVQIVVALGYFIVVQEPLPAIETTANACVPFRTQADTLVQNDRPAVQLALVVDHRLAIE